MRAEDGVRLLGVNGQYVDGEEEALNDIRTNVFVMALVIP